MEIYLLRHARPDFSVHEDRIRPLSEEGMIEAKKACDFLAGEGIERIYSSPYKRSVQTIELLASELGLEIVLKEDFRERKICDEWIEDFEGFCRNQWNDFEYKLEDGESLNEVQARNIGELKNIVENDDANKIAIGTHGTALSTMLNSFSSEFDYKFFQSIKSRMPVIIYIKVSDNMELKEWKILKY
jgi:2,3-bisphosphoglycerate-dependent phosphoglycerate mutase